MYARLENRLAGSAWMAAVATTVFGSFLGGGRRAKMYKKLARLMEHDVSLLEAVSNLKNRALKRGASDFEAVVLKRVEKRLHDGLPPGQAFARFVPVNEGVILQSYDADFIKGLKDCAKSIEDAAKIRGHIVAALAAPLFYAALLLGVMYVYGSMVLPKIAVVLPFERWTGTLRGLALMSFFTTSVWFWVFLAGLVLSFALFAVSLPRFTGPVRAFLDRFPPYSIYRILVGAATLQSLASLMHSGRSVPQALQRIERLSRKNLWLSERVNAALFHLRSGEQLGEAFFKSKLNFPDNELNEDLMLYATLDHFDRTLIDIARSWTEQSIDRVSATSKAANNFMLMLVGGTMAYMVTGILTLGSRIQEYMHMSHMM